MLLWEDTSGHHIIRISYFLGFKFGDMIDKPDQYYLVPDSERTIYYSTNNVSSNGVFKYQLDPPIPLQC